MSFSDIFTFLDTYRGIHGNVGLLSMNSNETAGLDETRAQSHGAEGYARRTFSNALAIIIYIYYSSVQLNFLVVWLSMIVPDIVFDAPYEDCCVLFADEPVCDVYVFVVTEI